MELIVDFPQERPRPTFPYSSGLRRASTRRSHVGSRSRSPRVRVSFAREVEIKVAENLSLRHKDRLWFTCGEMHSFRDNLARTVNGILSCGISVAEYAEINVEDTSLFLGLEGYLSADTPGEIRRRRRASWEAVEEEQMRQLDAGVHDPEEMADVAERESAFSRQRARIIGLLHAPKKK